ncbi:MAG: hypothetical protein IPM39_17565 [Chloroflexi bacterium]|nr:hypothetical protein [Chloroflexota bacterium]
MTLHWELNNISYYTPLLRSQNLKMKTAVAHPARLPKPQSKVQSPP